MFRAIALFLAATVCAVAAPSVRILQAEYVRSGGFQPAYSKFPGIVFIHGSPGSESVAPGTSDHATQVFSILNSSGLVFSDLVCDASAYTGPVRGNLVGLNPTSPMLESAKATWQLENHSWGGNDNAWLLDQPEQAATRTTPYIPPNPGLLSRFVQRLERDNVVAFVALPNPGDVTANSPLRLLSDVDSPFVVKVASLASGYKGTTAKQVPDIWAADYWNSYAAPRAALVGIAALQWFNEQGFTQEPGPKQYKAQDIKTAILATAKADASGRLVIDPAAALLRIKTQYASTASSVPVQITPVYETVKTGQTVTFTCTVQGSTPLRFAWLRNSPQEDGDRGFLEIPGATGQTYTIPSASLTDSAAYYCVVKNDAGTTASNTAYLTVQDAPPVVVPPPPPPTGKPGKIKTLTHSSGWAPSKISWTTQDCVNVVLIDPNGYAMPVPANGSFTATRPCGKGTWTLKADGTDGKSVAPKTDAVRAAAK